MGELLQILPKTGIGHLYYMGIMDYCFPLGYHRRNAQGHRQTMIIVAGAIPASQLAAPTNNHAIR